MAKKNLGVGLKALFGGKQPTGDIDCTRMVMAIELKGGSPVAVGSQRRSVRMVRLQSLPRPDLAGWRRILRIAVANGLYHSGFLGLSDFWRWKILRRREVCVIGLHRVLTREEFKRSNSLNGILLRQETFDSLLKYLDNNFSMLDLSGFLQVTNAERPSSSPRCLLTFDDGWRDNYTNAYPLLQKYRIPAAIFLVTALVGTSEIFWVERLKKAWNDPSRQRLVTSAIAKVLPQTRTEQNISLEEVVEYAKHMPSEERVQLLERLLPVEFANGTADVVDQMMSWEEITEIARGGIEIGAHTDTHPLMTYEDNSTIHKEVNHSKRALEERLPVRVRAFAYPNGDWDGRVREEVVRAGFECAFTTRRGWHRSGEDLFSIHRILLHEGNVTGLDGKFSPAVFNFTLARRR